MINILEQHARERKLTIILFIISITLLALIQWQIGLTPSEVVDAQ